LPGKDSDKAQFLIRLCVDHRWRIFFGPIFKCRIGAAVPITRVRGVSVGISSLIKIEKAKHEITKTAANNLQVSKYLMKTVKNLRVAAIFLYGPTI
jgi:hypothetical protein